MINIIKKKKKLMSVIEKSLGLILLILPFKNCIYITFFFIELNALMFLHFKL